LINRQVLQVLNSSHYINKSGNSHLIVSTAKGSPAYNAGLNALQGASKQVLAGVAIVGSLTFPPAMILAPVLVSFQIGREGDLIIGRDGWRVRNVLDFENDPILRSSIIKLLPPVKLGELRSEDGGNISRPAEWCDWFEQLLQPRIKAVTVSKSHGHIDYHGF